MKIKISTCIIVKNEEKLIEKCIKSVLTVSNEIIILDTGSSDKTKDICRVVGEGCRGGFQTLPYVPKIKLFETEWADDFSKARNQCISYATGDWVLVLDADDVLTPYTQENLLTFLEQLSLKDEPLVLSFKILNPQPNNSLIQSTIRSTMFNNGFGIHYKRPIHEQLYAENKALKFISCPSMSIFHFGNLKPSAYLESKIKKYAETMINIINKDKDDYYYYPYLGDAFSSLREHKKALESYITGKNLFEKSGKRKNSLTYTNILMSLIKEMVSFNRNYSEAIRIINELLEITPDFPDALFYLGLCYQKLGNFSKAIKIHEYTLNLLGNADDLNPLCITSFDNCLNIILMCEIARSYFVINEEEKALNFLKNAYLINHEFNDILFQLARYYLVSENLSQALFYLEKNTKFSILGKEVLYEVAETGINDISYKTAISVLLKNLKKFDGWLPQELDSMEKKIMLLEQNISNR